jgi:hypothetical protein
MTKQEIKDQNELLIEIGQILEENIFDYEMTLYQPILSKEGDEICGRYVFNKGTIYFDILLTIDYEIKWIDRYIPRNLLMEISNILIRIASNENEQSV